MYKIYDYSDEMVFRSEDISEIRDYLEYHCDRDDCDFIEAVEDYVNENSSFDIIGLSDWYSAAEILRAVDESAFDDLCSEYFDSELDNVIYDIEHYSSERHFFDYRIVDSDEPDEEDSNPDLVKIYHVEARDSEEQTFSIYLESIYFNSEEAETELAKLNSEAKPSESYYIAHGANHRPCKADIMRDL